MAKFIIEFVKFLYIWHLVMNYGTKKFSRTNWACERCAGERARHKFVRLAASVSSPEWNYEALSHAKRFTSPWLVSNLPRGRRYAHPVALNMTACSKPSEKFTSWSISNAFNLFLGFRAKKYHWNEYKESGPFLGEANLLVSKANLNFNHNSTSFFKKIFYWTKLIGKKAVSYYVWRKFASQTLASYDLPFFISDVCFIICFRYCFTHSNVLVMQSFTVLQLLKYIKEVSRVLLLERFSVLRR